MDDPALTPAARFLALSDNTEGKEPTMPTATMISKGQITIPKAIRDQLDLRSGDKVRFVLRDDRVVELRAKTLDIRN